MSYKAVFFDRDNTLTYGNPAKLEWRKHTIEKWSGKQFQFGYERMLELFDKAGYPKTGHKSIESEKEFWKRYYLEMLKGEGINEELEARAELLFSELWCNNDRLLFDEVIEVLEYFKRRGVRMGVISDTTPSLQLTLEQLGLGKYFDSYTCSDLVGVMKPDPLIFNTALKTLRVSAQESLYVDNYDVEADGARELGFTAFHIDRKAEHAGVWKIRSLREIVDYVEAQVALDEEKK